MPISINVDGQLLSEKDVSPTNIDQPSFMPASQTASGNDDADARLLQLGDPLHIEIACIYTGNSAAKRKRDFMIVSATKGSGSFNAQPKALNQLYENLGSFEYKGPSAFQQGSTTVYYTPSYTGESLDVSFQVIDDNFDASIVSKLKQLFNAAGNMPLFAPASSILMAGSQVLDIANSLAKHFLESSPFIDDSFRLRQDEKYRNLLDFRVVWANTVDSQTLDSLNEAYKVVIREPDNLPILVSRDASVTPYQGEHAFIIVHLGNKSVQALEDFQATHASAAILEQFYPKDNAMSSIGNSLGEAMKVFNDLNTLNQIRGVERDLKLEDTNSEKYVESQKQLNALKKKMMTSEFQEIVDS